VPTNADALVGRPAEALTEITLRDGRVKLAGEVWSARIAPGTDPLPAGTDVLVVRIDGATAVVRAVPSAPSVPTEDPRGEEPA
jgi:membrane protein implicated in regulation of membrane protease activity